LSSAGRQAEAVFDEGFLARPVAAVHAADLRHGHVALVDKQQPVVGEVVQQGGRCLAGGATGQVPRIVFDAGAEAHFTEQLQVVHRALLEALGLEELVVGLQRPQAVGELLPNAPDGPFEVVTTGHVVARRVDGDLVESPQHLPAQRIDLGDGIDGVPKNSRRMARASS